MSILLACLRVHSQIISTRPGSQTRPSSRGLPSASAATAPPAPPAAPPLTVGGMTAAAQRGGGYKEGEILCELRPGAKAKDVVARYNLTVKKTHQNNQYLFSLKNSITVEQMIVRLSRDPDIVSVEPTCWMALDQVGTDQGSTANIDPRSMPFLDGQSPANYFGQYAVTLIRATQAHAYATGQGVTVAVVDTGVDTDHPVFRYVTAGYDFVNNDTNPSETGSGSAYGHGTHVAGVIALVAPDATIMPIRAFDATGYGDASSVASAIQWAVDHGAEVINMSFSMSGQGPRVLQDAIQYANGRGVTLVASAGNDGSSIGRYPASDDKNGVLSVAATDQNDLRASFSSYGSHTDMCAPGVGIYSAYPGGQWAWWDGTSFSAPMVSGEAALLLSIGRPTSRITSTAVPVQSSGMGSGRINCLAAVSQ